MSRLSPSNHQDDRSKTSWGGTDGDADDGRVMDTVISCFERQVQQSATRRALKTQDDDWTYDQLNGLCNRIAHTILQTLPAPLVSCRPSKDVCIEDASEPVIVLMSQSAMAIAAVMGVLKAGKVVVLVEPDDTECRVRQIIQDLPAKMV